MQKLKGFRLGSLVIVKKKSWEEAERLRVLHHNVDLIHAKCGSEAIEKAAGEFCNACLAFPTRTPLVSIHPYLGCPDCLMSEGNYHKTKDRYDHPLCAQKYGWKNGSVSWAGAMVGGIIMVEIVPPKVAKS